MVQLSVDVQYNDALEGRVRDALASFLRQEARERRIAAETATEATRAVYRFAGGRARRALAPPRRGRPTTRGNLTSLMHWRITSDGVEFDRNMIDRRAPYWIIQEIGTGESATIRRGGKPNPRGRPRADADYRVQIKPQTGRTIPGHLAWGTRLWGPYSPSSPRNPSAQLFPRAAVTGAPLFRKRMVISKEIKGVHFVKQGGLAGYKQYHTSMGRVWRNTLVKRYRP